MAMGRVQNIIFASHFAVSITHSHCSANVIFRMIWNNLTLHSHQKQKKRKRRLQSRRRKRKERRKRKLKIKKKQNSKKLQLMSKWWKIHKVLSVQNCTLYNHTYTCLANITSIFVSASAVVQGFS